jgi:hypothetical protein
VWQIKEYKYSKRHIAQDYVAWVKFSKNVTVTSTSDPICLGASSVRVFKGKDAEMTLRKEYMNYLHVSDRRLVRKYDGRAGIEFLKELRRDKKDEKDEKYEKYEKDNKDL